MKDIIGNKYGLLTACERAGKSGTVQLIRCKCDCGNEIIVRYPNLTNGTTKSCGCMKKQATSKRRLKDLTGMRFGELTVLNRASDIGGKKVLWTCLCSCGHTCVVTGSNLKSGNTTSCGCMKESFNEGIIVHMLSKYHVSYEKEVKFDDLLSPRGNPLRFDFKVFTKNGFFLIEYQGSQHYYGTDSSYGVFAREYSDEKKKEYCKERGIELVEITYLDNTEETLLKILENHAIIYDDTVPTVA